MPIIDIDSLSYFHYISYEPEAVKGYVRTFYTMIYFCHMHDAFSRETLAHLDEFGKNEIYNHDIKFIENFGDNMCLWDECFSISDFSPIIYASQYDEYFKSIKIHSSEKHNLYGELDELYTYLVTYFLQSNTYDKDVSELGDSERSEFKDTCEHLFHTFSSTNHNELELILNKHFEYIDYSW